VGKDFLTGGARPQNISINTSDIGDEHQTSQENLHPTPGLGIFKLLLTTLAHRQLGICKDQTPHRIIQTGISGELSCLRPFIIDFGVSIHMGTPQTYGSVFVVIV
jgi:hypothetical protein